MSSLLFASWRWQQRCSLNDARQKIFFAVAVVSMKAARIWWLGQDFACFFNAGLRSCHRLQLIQPYHCVRPCLVVPSHRCRSLLSRRLRRILFEGSARWSVVTTVANCRVAAAAGLLPVQIGPCLRFRALARAPHNYLF